MLRFASLLKFSCKLCAFERIQLNPLQRSFYSTFTVKDLFVHESHGETGTLNSRFTKHLAMESCKFDPIIPTTIKYSDFYPVHDVRNFNKLIEDLPTDQIPKFLIFTYTYKTNGDLHKVAHVLNKIDEICTARFDEMDYDGILRVLQAFLFVIPNKITKLRFYEYAMRRLVEDFRPSFPEQKFVQTCFFLGMWKRNEQSTKLMNNFLRTNLPKYLDALGTLDFAIVTSAAYKTSLPINLSPVQDRLVQEIDKLDCKDDGLVVNFIKCLRLNRIKSVKLYEKLKSHLLSGKMDHFHFKGLIHCFAYFAEGLWNDAEACKGFVQKSLQRLENYGKEDDEIFNDLRAKDFATFLWCCSNLGLNELKPKDLELLEAIILDKIEYEEYKFCPDELIDSALALWMLNYKSKGIISSVLELQQIPSTKRAERVKLDSRHRLLLNCVEIEHIEWLPKNLRSGKAFIEDREAPNYLIDNRNALQAVKRLIDERKDELGIVSNQIVCPIGELNVAGILLETKDDKFYLEVLEDNQVLKFTNQPVAIVQLKINLLKILDYKVQVIGPKDYTSEDELLTLLKSKISCSDGSLNVKEAVA